MNMHAALRALPAYLAGLAAKHGIKLRIGAYKPMTDGETVYLPALPLPDGQSTPDQLRYLDEVRRLCVGWVLHEACHIRMTEFGDFDKIAGDLGLELTPVLHGFFNTLEDIRIEYQMGTRWAGISGIRSDTIKVMRSRGIGALSPDGMSEAQVLQYHLFWRLRQTALRNTGIDDLVELFRNRAAELFGGTFVDLVETISEEVLDAPDSRAVWRVAGRLVAALEAHAEPPAPPADPSQASGDPQQDDATDQASNQADEDPDQGASGDADLMPGDSEASSDHSDDPGVGDVDGEGDSAPGTAGSSGSVSNADTGDESPGDDALAGSPGQSAEADPADSSEATAEQRGAAQKALAASLEEVATHEDEALAKALGTLTSEEEAALHGATTRGGRQLLTESPAPPVRFGSGRLARTAQTSSAIATRVARFLNAQGRAERLAVDRGRQLHGRRLAQVRTTGRVFLKKARTELIDTAVTLLVDSSGSMNGQPLELALDAALAVGAALESHAGVSVAVVAFPEIVPIVRHGQRVRTRAGCFGIAAGGGTPLGDALWWVGADLLAQRHPRKIVLSITDGEPDDAVAVQAAVKALHSQGIECLSLGIFADLGKVTSMFGRARVVSRLEDLPQAIVDLLRPSLAAVAA